MYINILSVKKVVNACSNIRPSTKPMLRNLFIYGLCRRFKYLPIKNLTHFARKQTPKDENNSGKVVKNVDFCQMRRRVITFFYELFRLAILVQELKRNDMKKVFVHTDLICCEEENLILREDFSFQE